MKYGDFASLVQLGVGLHVGTALLQLYGELGVQPLIRRITRIKGLFADDPDVPAEVEDELHRLESAFEIFKIRLFNEYKKYVQINSVVAVLLVILLTFIAYKAEDIVTVGWTIVIVALSVLPAPATLGCLWIDATRALKPIKNAAHRLEDRALKGK